MDTSKLTWKNVSRQSPCQVCKSPRWCRVSTDGTFAICRRQMGGRQKSDGNGATYWVSRLSDAPINPVPSPPKVESDPELVHRAYAALMSCPAAALSEEHQAGLRVRGLDRRTTVNSGCRSLPRDERGRGEIIHAVAKAIGGDNLGKIPGIGFRWGRAVFLTGLGPALLIPTSDYHTGRLVAIHLRHDSPGKGPRYTWFSSSCTGGPGPRLAPFIAYPVGQAGPWDTARLTEGELKALVAAQYTGMLTVSVPGCSLWKMAIDPLKALGVRKILLALDSDWRTNPHVARALVDANAGLEAAGFLVDVETWPEQYKGIDDYLTRLEAV